MQIKVEGVKETRKAIRLFAPDLSKALDKELRRVLAPLTRKARGFVEVDSPLSGWAGRSFSEGRFPFYNAAVIKSGIGFTTKPGMVTRSGFTSNARIFNKSAVGAIYETAGRKSATGQEWVGPKAGGASKGVSRSANPNAGRQFIDALPPLVSSLKGRGRLILRAWAEDKGKVQGAALKAIDTAERAFKARAEKQTFNRAA